MIPLFVLKEMLIEAVSTYHWPMSEMQGYSAVLENTRTGDYLVLTPRAIEMIPHEEFDL